MSSAAGAPSDSVEAEQYRRSGHVALPALFPAEVLDAFYRQARADLGLSDGRAIGYLQQSKLMHRPAVNIHSDRYPPMTAFLWGLTPRIAQIAGCTLLPSYAFLRLYQQSEICRVHADRGACEHSVSLTIASAGDAPWALAVGTGIAPDAKVRDDFDGEPFVSVPLRPGDALAYRGIDRRHGRVQPNPNRWSAHLFLHWVDANGPHRDHAFDRVRQAKIAAAS